MGSDGEKPASAGRDGETAGPLTNAADARVWEAVAAAEFTGPLWNRLIEQAVRAALPRVRKIIRTGLIFELCHRRNRMIKLRAPSHWCELDMEEIAGEVVAEAVLRFQKMALRGDGWSPSGGASLLGYFLGICIDEFPNRFRSWLDRRGASTRASVEFGRLPARCAPDPLRSIEASDSLHRALVRLPRRQQRAILLQAKGFMHTEIADRLGITARAVEGLLRRARTGLRLNGEGEVAQ